MELEKVGEKMSFKKYAICFLILIVGITFISAKFYADGQLKKKLDQCIADNPLPATYESASVTWFGFKPFVKGVKFSLPNLKQPVTINKVYFPDYDTEHEIPHYMTVDIRGLVAPRNNFFKNLGYKDDNLNVNAYINYKYDSKKMRFDLNTLRWTAENVAQIESNFHFSNIKLNNSLIFSYPNIQIEQATMKIVDDTLMDQVMTHNAKIKGKTKEQFVKNTLNRLEYMKSQAKSKWMKDSFDELAKFYKNPQSLTIQINPDKPVTIRELNSEPNNIKKAKLLNLQIKS